MNNKRCFEIDLLRSIGIIGIFISHAQAPNWAISLRSFDVPLMVFISAICYKEKIGKNMLIQYVRDRFIRLVFPVWIFVICYYILNHGLIPFIGKSDFGTLIDTLLLLTPSYVWIIRVFFSMALLVPFLYLFVKRNKDTINCLVIVLACLVNEFLCHRCGVYYGDGYWQCITVMTLSYSIVAFSGLIAKTKNRKSLLKFSFTWGALYLLQLLYFFITTNGIVLVQSAKYPPRFYYLSYGLTCCFFIYAIRDNLSSLITNVFLRRAIAFIGSHSMWIYLWHILFVTTLGDRYFWEIRFIIILLLPSIIVYIQSSIVTFFLLQSPRKKLTRVLNKIFIG